MARLFNGFTTLFLIIPVFLRSQALPEIPAEPDYKTLPVICLNETEQSLLREVNAYRELKGLKPVQLSRSLTYVAQMHVWDLSTNDPFNPRRCNLHSWSSKGPWKGCCYTDDQKRASCMWNKPAELTNYRHSGYEIAFWTNESLSPEAFATEALDAWKKSRGHNTVIVNEGEWNDIEWNAIGVGVAGGYAVVWFGAVPDEESVVEPCKR